ncbi:cytochrome P450 [Halotia branconii]|uniref:Cytochrome P450 n=1 Tax=Halotia branconii CENA392 TaxID=1539056 RepID=A0AAJ6NMG3_9CYAN|nr:cytochrome P450 [Halotia branconii]WGV23218.1 cytochrome P450 [Halotia branconii CENA392]
MSQTQFSSTQTPTKFSHQLPPGPRGYLLLSLPKIQQDSLGYLSQMWQEYGNLVRLPVVPSYTFYLAAHPNYVEHMLSTHQERYSKPDLFNKSMSLMVGQSILTSEGDFWLKHRRLMQPAFHQKYLENLSSVMVSCTESLLEEWQQKLDNEVIDIVPEMMRLTLKIVGLALFNKDISVESSTLGQAFREAFNYVSYKINNVWTEPLWIPTSRNLRFRQAKQILDRAVLDIINSRRQNPLETHDLLSMLLTAQDEVTKEGMTDKQLQDEVITLVAAGHETVASALSWTWYLLGKHPDVAANMQDELQTILNGSSPTIEKLPQLAYTRRIFDESMRLYPPSWGLPRVALEDDEIQGYFIPKGTIINIAQFIIHRHPEFWENPDQFDPDRFLPEKVNQRPKFTYFPFGAGQRICIGKSFALMEATIIMASIFQRFHIELVSHQSIEPDATFTLRPKYGIKVKVRKKVK